MAREDTIRYTLGSGKKWKVDGFVNLILKFVLSISERKSFSGLGFVNFSLHRNYLVFVVCFTGRKKGTLTNET